MSAPAANIEASINQVLGFIGTWVRRFAALGLLVFIFLKILTLFGLPTYFAIPSIDWQAFGVFVAGTAYALGVKQ